LERISVTIASRQDDDRNRMAALLTEQDGFTVASIAWDNFGIVRSAMTRQPNVIIMDFFLEDYDTLRLIPTIKRNSPATELIVLCSPEDHIAVDRVLRAGVSGYLIKQDLDRLAFAVRSVFCGGLYVSKTVRMQAFKYFSRHNIVKTPLCDANAIYNVFTPTELQIFHGIILGHSDSKIAENLNISTGAVRNCICHAKKKVGLQNRTQISLYALSNGLITWENDFFEEKKGVKNGS